MTTKKRTKECDKHAKLLLCLLKPIALMTIAFLDVCKCGLAFSAYM